MNRNQETNQTFIQTSIVCRIVALLENEFSFYWMTIPVWASLHVYFGISKQSSLYCSKEKISGENFYETNRPMKTVFKPCWVF